MINRLTIDPEARSEWGVIHLPDSDERGARSAQVEPGGDAKYLEAQAHKFDARNSIHAASAAAVVERKRSGNLNRQLRRTKRRLARTRGTLTTAKLDRKARVRWYHVAAAIVLATIALLGATVSNVVLSEYVLKSASDLFANNPTGAGLFATLPFMGAVALKVFERGLISDASQRRYAAIFFIIGILCLCVWIGAAAIAFAPEISASNAWLSSSGTNNTISIVLVMTTIICDVTLGFVILSGAEQLLSGRRIVTTLDNPRHAHLISEKGRLETALDESSRRQRDAEDYLVRAEAGRVATREQSEQDLARARELWIQVQTAALSFAIGQFVNPNV